jgi:hypothetical protein
MFYTNTRSPVKAPALADGCHEMRFRRTTQKRSRWSIPLQEGLLGLGILGFGAYLLAAHRELGAGAWLVLIGAGVCLKALAPLLVRGEREAPRIDFVLIEGNYLQGLVFPLSRRRQWLSLLIFIMLSAVSVLGAVLISSPVLRILESLVLVVLLFLIWRNAKALREPRRVLALLADGVVTPAWKGSRLVPWDTIERTTVFHDQYGDTFGLVLKNPDSSSQRRFWHRREEPDVVLPVDDLVASGGEFRETLERCLADPEARSAIGYEFGRAKSAAA